MTGGWLVSTRSDRGGGFRPDPERSSPSLPVEVAAEFAALEPLYPQLAVGGSSDAEGIAVVTYRYSPRLGSWIVVVQGSAGGYGPAGAIQLAVLPDASLLDAMSASLPVVRRDGWLMPSATERPRVTLRPAGPEVTRALAGLLRLDSSRRVLVLPGGQGEVDQLLVRLARILPEGVAQAYTWSTSLAAARIEAGETVISGEWPDALRARHRDIHRALSSRADGDTGARQAGGRLPEGLAWVLGEASERRYPGRRSRATDLPEWLDELEARRPLTVGEALKLLDGPVEGPQARRWADGDVSGRLLTDDVERLETLLTHPSEVVSRGAVGALELPGVWGQLVRIERRRAAKGRAPMLPPGLLPVDALVLLAEDVAGGAKASGSGADYLAGLVRQDPRLLAPLTVEMARQGSYGLAPLLAAFPWTVSDNRAAVRFLRECSRHLPASARPEDVRALRWTVAEAVATAGAEHRTGRAVVDDATDAAILRFATGVADNSVGDDDRLGRLLTWFVLLLVAVSVAALIVAVLLLL